MEIIKENGFGELVALCGGCCSCATCHVYFDRGFASALPRISADEDALLDSSEHRKDNSRLACQVKFAQAMNGMTVTIAPEG
jgi:2Fe-2S ferredoxin